jgi:hypothetical protein
MAGVRVKISPTIMKIGSYRFFFNSNEESRMHVHIQTPDGVAKFWLEPILPMQIHTVLVSAHCVSWQNL